MVGIDADVHRKAELGQLLYQHRFLRGMSQTALAAEIGVSAAAVSRWESGGRVPTIPTLRSLSRALEIPMERMWEVLQGEEQTAHRRPATRVRN
jgi:transcriptional regulator with XRE-family HTH domain